MANTTKHIMLITRFVNKPGKKTLSPRKLTERCSTRKNEKIKENDINTTSQQKIIHLGANFFKKIFDILSILFGVQGTYFKKLLTKAKLFQHLIIASS